MVWLRRCRVNWKYSDFKTGRFEAQNAARSKVRGNRLQPRI